MYKRQVFGSGSRATVAVLLAVKDPAHTGGCELHYRDIGDYLSREEKLDIIRTAGLSDEGWQTLEPNAKGEWLNQSTDEFQEYAPLGAKNTGSEKSTVFRTFCRGLESSRDAWVYEFSARDLVENIEGMTAAYEIARKRFAQQRTVSPNESAVAQWLKSSPTHACLLYTSDAADDVAGV